MKRILLITRSFSLSIEAQSYSIALKPITFSNLSELQSFAFGQSNRQMGIHWRMFGWLA